jgi:hypothetical protein
MSDFEKELLKFVETISKRLDNIEKHLEIKDKYEIIEEEAKKLADDWILKDKIYRRAATIYNENVESNRR